MCFRPCFAGCLTTASLEESLAPVSSWHCQGYPQSSARGVPGQEAWPGLSGYEDHYDHFSLIHLVLVSSGNQT